jgi:hypothetical protein
VCKTVRYNSFLQFIFTANNVILEWSLWILISISFWNNRENLHKKLLSKNILYNNVKNILGIMSKIFLTIMSKIFFTIMSKIFFTIMSNNTY